MKPISIAMIAAATLIAIGAAYLVAGEPRNEPWPKPTPPPPPSPVFAQSKESAPTEEEIELMISGHDDAVVAEIERALASRDFTRRETAFAFLLPELIQMAPARVEDMVARQVPGEARDVLVTEVARQWVSWDREAAMKWLASLNDAERRAGAAAAIRELTPWAPEEAVVVANGLRTGLTESAPGNLPPTSDAPAAK